MEGKQVVLTCESDANPPVSHYVWLDWNNQEFYFGQMLKLEPTTIQHSGAYRCQGTNRLGRAESPPRTLTIYCKAPCWPWLPSTSRDSRLCLAELLARPSQSITCCCYLPLQSPVSPSIPPASRAPSHTASTLADTPCFSWGFSPCFFFGRL